MLHLDPHQGRGTRIFGNGSQRAPYFGTNQQDVEHGDQSDSEKQTDQVWNANNQFAETQIGVFEGEFEALRVTAPD